MKTTKRLVSVLLALVLAFGVLSLTASAETCGVRSIAIIEKPVYYQPDEESSVSWNAYFYRFLRVKMDAGSSIDDSLICYVDVYSEDDLVYQAECLFTLPADADGCLNVGWVIDRGGVRNAEHDRPYKIRMAFQKELRSGVDLFDGMPAATFNGSDANMAVTESETSYIVTISLNSIRQSPCTCTCHGRKEGESRFLWFFKEIFWYFVQLRLWSLFNKEEHRACDCGKLHW